MKQKKLTLEETTRLTKLGEIASDLLVKIVDEHVPKEAIPTETDLLFKRTLEQIYYVCPLLSKGYVLMYNQIQKDKINSDSTYLKKIILKSLIEVKT
jgi:FKBP-type peptidyl-prolyl cis-trans isomerase (trigger factor)